jgi:hypothetical protein
MTVFTKVNHRIVSALSTLLILSSIGVLFAAMPQTSSGNRDYKLLATQKTSTMQKELNEAADAGYRFERAMGGQTGFGGKEVVSIMSRNKGETRPRYEYKLMATNKTSTMQKELQEAANLGFEYRDQTVFETTFGGNEVVIIAERDREAPARRWEYKLLATNKTSTMQKELQEAADLGFQFVGVTVSKTAFGGNEVVSILRRPTSSGN